MAFSDQKRPYSGGKFVGYLVAYGISRVAGINIWLPVILCGICIWGVTKIRPLFSEHFRYAIGILLGQAASMLVGIAVMPEYFMAILPDIVFAIGITAWIVLRPAKIAVFVLIALEILGIGSNVYSISLLPGWSPEMGGIVVAAVLRAAILGFGIAALQTDLVRSQSDEQLAGDVFP